MTKFYNEYKEYVTQEGDRWDSIAYKEYGNCFNYKYLVMANPQVPISPIIKVGTKLIIPVLPDSKQANEDLPPWKK